MLRNAVSFLIYLGGVAFISWHYYALKASLDIASLLVVLALFCLGLSKFASYLAMKVPARSE
jgi:hypothetical protein